MNIDEYREVLREEKNRWNREMSEADKEQQDILHAIEFGNYNAAKGAVMLKRLKAVRIKRREAKEQYDQVLALLHNYCTIKDKCNKLRNKKHYYFRTDVIKDLFKEGL